MRIYKTKNYDEMSRKAANIISAQIILKPESVLGLATGSSPIGTYKQLIELLLCAQNAKFFRIKYKNHF